jgi:hypothetical protein
VGTLGFWTHRKAERQKGAPGELTAAPVATASALSATLRVLCAKRRCSRRARGGRTELMQLYPIQIILCLTLFRLCSKKSPCPVFRDPTPGGSVLAGVARVGFMNQLMRRRQLPCRTGPPCRKALAVAPALAAGESVGARELDRAVAAQGIRRGRRHPYGHRKISGESVSPSCQFWPVR